MKEIVAHLCAHYHKFPSEVKAYSDFGELVQTWSVLRYDAKSDKPRPSDDSDDE